MNNEDRWEMEADKPVHPHVAPTHRQLLSNVIDDWKKDAKGQDHPVQWYKPIDAIGEEIRGITGGWPRVAGGLPFVCQNDESGGRKIRTFSRTPALFAWIQEVADCRWSNNCCESPDTSDVRTPVTKEEFFQHVLHSSPKQYTATSPYPHSPEMPGVYYIPPPAVPGIVPGVMTGKLEEFIDSLNPETDLDRDLLRAAILTPGWGGEAGTRPAFVLAADRKGAGKSATAEAICDIWGGPFKVNLKDKAEDINKKLMSDAGLAQRCVFMDNLRGKVANVDFESYLTCKTLGGHRMFVGYFTRPNFLTWFLTANTPRLGDDMTIRSVVIHMGDQQHGKSWVAWAGEFIRTYRWHIIHDCILLLQGPPKGTIQPGNRDRFQGWQDGVLTRSGASPDKLAALIAARRADVNADDESAHEVAEAIKSHMKERGLDPSIAQCKFTRKEMHALLTKHELIGSEMTAKGAHSWLIDLRSCAPLAYLRDHRVSNGRLWVWNPTSRDYDGEIPV